MVRPKRRLYAAHQRLYHLFLAHYHLCVVYGYILCYNAILFAVGRAVVELGAVKQGLGGHAALVKAYAAQLPLLYAEHLHAGMACPLRRQIPRGTSAEYYKIISHSILPPLRGLAYQQRGKALKSRLKLRKEPRGRRPVQRSVVVCERKTHCGVDAYAAVLARPYALRYAAYAEYAGLGRVYPG